MNWVAWSPGQTPQQNLSLPMGVSENSNKKMGVWTVTWLSKWRNAFETKDRSSSLPHVGQITLGGP